MKILFSIAGIILICVELFSQEYKFDSRPLKLKDDGQNYYKSELVNTLDLLQAIEMAGITINKFSIGSFDREYTIRVILEEFKDGIVIETDTILQTSNKYSYFVKGKEGYYVSYIDSLKIFTKEEATSLTLKFRTYAMSSKEIIEIEKYDKDSFYNIRSFVDTEWKHNEKIPLLVYASSWEDKEYGYHRFCGVVNLRKNDASTQELLSSSPHYFMISYVVN
jgi:hypothetical protein